MGYDVCLHPISPEEMRAWYVTPLEWVRQGEKEKARALAVRYGIESRHENNYLNVLQVGCGIKPEESFDKTHGFFIAVIQGFFRDFYCTRGSGFTFLFEKKPEYARYFTPWNQIIPNVFPNPAQNAFFENYCSGVYLSLEQVNQLLQDLEHRPEVLEDLKEIWPEKQFPVLLKALHAAQELKTGLLEATESCWYTSKTHYIDEYSK